MKSKICSCSCAAANVLLASAGSYFQPFHTGYRSGDDSQEIIRICHDLSRSVTICQDLSRSVKICQDVRRSVKICQHVLWCVKMCQDVSIANDWQLTCRLVANYNFTTRRHGIFQSWLQENLVAICLRSCQEWVWLQRRLDRDCQPPQNRNTN